METKDLAYWLQGCFELGDLIRGSQIVLNDVHYQCILKHIALVKEHEKADVSPFVTWLEGFISGANIQSISDEEIASKVSGEIRQKLAELFEHVIDKSYGDAKVQSNRNKIHGRRFGGGSFGRDIRYAC